MTKPSNISTIEDTTGSSWAEWVKWLDQIDAKNLTHTEIAARVHDKLKGKLDNPGWWSQSVTVAYEQHIGRRKPGQRGDGTYESTLTKTLSGDMESVMQLWLGMVGHKTGFDGVLFSQKPTISKTDKRRHWGCNFEDGTRLNIDVYSKNKDQSVLALTHTKLKSKAAAESWKAYWQGYLGAALLVR